MPITVPFKRLYGAMIRPFTAAILRRWWVIAATTLVWMGSAAYSVYYYPCQSFPVVLLVIPDCLCKSVEAYPDSRRQVGLQRKVSQVGWMVTSQRTKREAWRSFDRLGMPYSALSSTVVRADRDSGALYIGVPLPDREFAMEAVEIIAQAAIRTLEEYDLLPLQEDRECAAAQVSRTAQDLVRAYDALETLKRERLPVGRAGAAASIELARLEADARAATHVYALAQSDLREATIRLEQADNDAPLMNLGSQTGRQGVSHDWGILCTWFSMEALRSIGVGVALAIAVHLLAFACLEPATPKT